MTAIASLLGPDGVAALARARAQAEQRQAEARAEPSRPAARNAPGTLSPVPPVVFRSAGTEASRVTG